MKKILYFFTLSTIFFTLLPAQEAKAQAVGEKILQYDVKIDVQKDSTLDIEERIIYDFTENASDRHGIFRIVPYYYITTKMEYEIISVLDELGKEYKYDLYEENNNFVLKIGDPNKNVYGVKRYNIKYTMVPGIVFPEGENFAKFHWDVIGHSWNIPIEKANVSISFPEQIDLTDEMVCFTGIIGSLEKNCEILQSPDKYSFQVQNTKQFNINEGMTVELKFGRDVITEPGKVIFSNDLWFGNVEIADKKYELPKTIYLQPGNYDAKFSRFGYEDKELNIEIISGETTTVEFETEAQGWFSLAQLLPYILIPLTIFLVHSIWKKKGRDLDNRKTIVVEFDPPKDLTPLEMGILKNVQVKNKDISATIIRFAVLGFLKIKYEEQKFLFFKKDKYSLQKLKNASEPLETYEIKLFNDLFKFGNTNGLLDLDDLQYKFIAPVEELKKSVWKSVLDKKLFERDPRSSKTITTVASFFSLFFIGALGVVFFAFFFSPAMIFVAFTAFVSTAILAKNIPQRSELGSQSYRHTKGLEIYLSVSEKERLKFHNAPEKKPEVFEKLLPYAIILNVEKNWAEAFKDIYKNPPDWYEGGNMHTFNAVLFTSALTKATSAATSSMTSSSSSGGSGSGGGGGGGGGGSW